MDPFDQHSDASNAPRHGSDPRGVSSGVPPRPWPRCPECQSPRLAHCPICQTVGTDFVPVDTRYTVVPQDPPPPEEVAPPIMVLCPTCDEPFFTTYPDHCPWCGHEFPDGYPLDEFGEKADDTAARTTAILLGLAAWATAFLLYLLLRS